MKIHTTVTVGQARHSVALIEGAVAILGDRQTQETARLLTRIVNLASSFADDEEDMQSVLEKMDILPSRDC